MTEAEWQQCTNIERMLDFLTVNHFDTAWGRRIHLFACGCVRRVWHLLVDLQSQHAVLTAERLVEGQATEEEVENTSDRAWEASEAATSPATEAAGKAAALLATTRSWDAAWDGSEKSAIAEMRDSGNDDYDAVRAVQCDLLRDIFGTLFRPVALVPSWLEWKDGTVVKLAQSIYDDRAFNRLPELADALEEAGCTNADILRHCRQAGEHVRGCWAVDLLLGKK